MKQYLKWLLIAVFMITVSFNAFGGDEGFSITKKEIINKAWKALFGKLKNKEVKSIYRYGPSRELLQTVLNACKTDLPG